MEPEPSLPPPRFQFRLSTLLGVTALLAVLSAVVGGVMRRADDIDAHPQIAFYLVAATMLPMLLMVLISLLRSVGEWIRAWRGPDER